MPSTRLRALRAAIKATGSPERAAGVARFFKTGPGEYGEGDRFLGCYVPELRKLARGARDLEHEDILMLLHSPWHEERLIALMLLVDAHERGDDAEKARVHRAYLANTAYVNNWDLVDTSAAELVGWHVAKDGTRSIEKLARSKSLWERRIAMVSTLYTTRHGNVGPALLIAERLLGDEHDLMHKAVGWMLREVGKRDDAALCAFLDAHAGAMPRTALRYAIERMSPADRRRYLAMPRATRGGERRPAVRGRS